MVQSPLYVLETTAEEEVVFHGNQDFLVNLDSFCIISDYCNQD